MDRDAQIKALSKALAMTVPAARMVTPQWAETLVDKFGVRVYPELATVGDKPVQVDRSTLLQVLRDMESPMAERVESAQSDEDKAALMQEIADKHPQLVAEFRAKIEALG